MIRTLKVADEGNLVADEVCNYVLEFVMYYINATIDSVGTRIILLRISWVYKLKYA